MTQEHSVLFFGMHESAFINFFIEDFNRMFLTFSFFAVRKHLRLRKMKNIGKYKVLCCLKNPFSIVLQTLECLIALLYIPWFSNYRHCSKVPDCHGIMHIQSQLVLLAIHDKLFPSWNILYWVFQKNASTSHLKVYYSSRFKLISQMIIFLKNKYYYI